MPTIALHTVLRAGRQQDYTEVHQAVPPAVAAALQHCGIRDWRIWQDDRDVFHLVDVDDLADFRAMRARLRDDPDNLAWQATVGPMFEVPDDYDGDDPVMASLWSLSAQLRPAVDRA